MNQFKDLYQDKLKSPEEIAAMIESGMVCASPTAMSQPIAITEAIADRARKNEIEGVKHHSIIAVNPAPFLEPELHGKYDYVSWFTTGVARKSVQEGMSDYMPCNYSEVSSLWKNRNLDVFYSVVTPMDIHGNFSFGLVSSENVELMNQAKYVFLEVNPNMPRVYGSNLVHISQVDAICEREGELDILPEVAVSDIDAVIGSLIAEQIPNGATLQFGIGGIPNAVGKCLDDKKDLGIHTELFTDSMVDLMKKGIVNNRRKALNPNKSVAAFAWGSKKMYKFLEHNLAIELQPVSYVNNPYTIGRIDNFMSINSALEIDILGQVCAESIGTVPFSGSGGQADFVRGCNLSKGGKSFIAMSATAKKGTISKIKPILTPGAAVTTSKNDVDYVVTEFGCVRLKGKTASERAKALISIAHPAFRKELTQEAKKRNLII
ncbi:MAG: 4-hydroxybutyrate--acetyl-CoA CoA transferase [Eubacterium sp.]|nr:4-hydroxybutyrate--acetyl-CoA CoA transferase [Eubacterium sp.]